MHTKIKELPLDERPYEKFLKCGAKALSDAELLAIILKTGSKEKTSIELAREVLKCPDGSSSILSIHKKSLTELKKIQGIGNVKAICLKCIAELAERIANSKYTNRSKFSSPKDIASFYMESFRHLDYEVFRVLYLDSSHCLIADRIISTGTVNRTLVSARDVFIHALSFNAVYVVLLHNHPSGNPLPSDEDIKVTNTLYNAGLLLNIEVIDHIIIGDKQYFSLREYNLFPSNSEWG